MCTAVKSACTRGDVGGEEVFGLGFAATCSLGLLSFLGLSCPINFLKFLFLCLRSCHAFLSVAVDSDGCPVTVSLSGDTRRNVIVWMDHRAIRQSERINARNSPVLQYCGGSVSPEMQPPKVV